MSNEDLTGRSPYGAPRIAIEQLRAGHGRGTDRIGIELPIRKEFVDNDVDLESVGADGVVPSEAVDAELSVDIATAVNGDFSYEYYSADVGRGASGLGVAWEVTQVLAEIGGAAVTLAWTGRRVRDIYVVIERKLGWKPCVSLGAAKHLAAAHLADELGTEDFTLLGSGLVEDPPVDFSYTGDNHFWVMFVAADKMYVYIVHETGRLKLVGDVPFVETWNGGLTDGSDRDPFAKWRA